MTALYGSLMVDGDPAKTIRFGTGLLIEVCDQVMTPERAELERAALEKEAREAEEAAAQEVLDQAEEAAFWAAQRGEQPPPKRTPVDVLREHLAATDRQDRREAREAHRPDCGCETCGARLIGSGIPDGPPRRPAAIVAKEGRAWDEAFLAQPATVASVADLSIATQRKFDALAKKFDRLLGRH